MLCDIIFQNDSTGKYVVLHRNIPLVKAGHLRKVSGDLVVEKGTSKVIKSKLWLWDWELKNPNCYAHRKVT